MSFKNAVLPLVCFAISGCGASSAKFAPDFEALVSESERLAARLEPLEQTAALNGAGAEYSGVIVLVDELDVSTTGTIGSVDLTADFVGETITGSGSGFFSTAVNSAGDPIGTGSPVAGDLAFLATDIGVTFDLGVEGDVVVSGALRPLDGVMLGGFFGDDADMIAAVGLDMPAGAIDLDAVLIAD